MTTEGIIGVYGKQRAVLLVSTRHHIHIQLIENKQLKQVSNNWDYIFEPELCLEVKT